MRARPVLALAFALAGCAGADGSASPPAIANVAAPQAIPAAAPPAPGAAVDAADREAITRTAQAALEANPPDEPLPWQDPASGHSGTIVPGPYYEAADGAFCRDFRETVTIGGATRLGAGRGCRQPDGNWRIVD